MAEERWGKFGMLMRRVIGPAGAVVVLYASIKALPSLMMSQPPPIDGRDLLNAFVVSLVGFGLILLYFGDGRKGDDDES